MVKSLNKVYENDELFYYCNACGDLNLPGTDPWSIHDPEELPPPARDLYNNYWTEGAGLTMYVVKYKDVTTIAVNALFDRGYMDDLEYKHGWEKDEDAFLEAVKSTAIMADIYTGFPLTILVGLETDPDGHEILFILPPDKCDKAADFAAEFGEWVYDTFELEYHSVLFWNKMRTPKSERK